MSKRTPRCSPTHPKQPTSIATLAYTEPTTLHLRDGELVIYRRTRSSVWQCRFKRRDGAWVRATTGCYSIESAVTAAAELFDLARFRERLGLAHRTHSFAHLARSVADDLRQQLDLGRGKSVYQSYITCIERYFAPFFGDKPIESITHKDMLEFETWRNGQMGKQPKASTLNNFASAWNRLISTAVERGWVSAQATIPRLSTVGVKSTPRPAFTREEVSHLLAFMVNWSAGGRSAAERLIRPLLRDYVEVLLYTGARHGTEALNIEWRHVSWHWHQHQKYLRLWVNGKTGGRWLIAKHRAVEPLQRLHSRQTEIKQLSFDDLLGNPVSRLVFRTAAGHQPTRLDGTFRRLLRDAGLLVDGVGQTRTLYSLRHTYATLELLDGTDIHTLSKQMGNSAAMIERHYSKLTATLAAERLA